MEDFWGILFYLAIIVLGGLASAYRNKKKRKMMTPPGPKPQEEPVTDEIPSSGFDPFEELAKRMKFDIEEPKAEIEAEPEPIDEAEPETRPEMPFQSDTVSLEAIVKTPEEEGIPAFEETREILETDTLYEDNMITNSQITDAEIIDKIQYKIDLDLAANIREGIIYSEILKRKHF
jgi:hypothetical protein